MLTTRRDLLELALRAAALPGGAEFMAIWLKAQEQNHPVHSPAPPESSVLTNREPKFFSPEDFEALQAFTEILIPTDDTPGAKEAHCAHYIDFLMTASYGLPVQKQWRDALAVLKETGFHAADAKGRAELVAAMAKPEVDRNATHPGFMAYRLIKQQNAFAFYTSRAGMIEALEYKGNSYNVVFPACTHPEHHQV
ncbi:MAG TPA: gluconate 2-dehydrogenase subunit 3 family protein [Bryobacteraceae bacterium]|nr:gluconate 2-dehydrogenase subunit 3 family protein [Bryobacteraceae bacterium]